MKLNRVVVTGYGLTSPIGNTPEEFWNNLKMETLELVKSLSLITALLMFIMQQKLTIFRLTNTLKKGYQSFR